MPDPSQAPPDPSGQQGSPPPGAAPMAVPDKPKGMEQGGRVDVLLALKVLQRALASMAPGSKESQVILKASSTLAKEFGDREDAAEELMPAEIQKMLQTLAGPGAQPQGGGGQPQQQPPQQ